MKKGAYPAKLPNCPSEKKPAERSLGSSDAREKISVQGLKSKRLSELETKTLNSKVEVSRITFYEIGHDTFSWKPFLKYSLVIFDDLNLKIWHGDEILSLAAVANIANGRKISFFDQINEILEYLKTLWSHPHLNISEEVNVCIKTEKSGR